MTVLASVTAFQNTELFDKLKFNAYMVYHKKEWYRLLSHGFIHGSWMHLIINMLVLYSFGNVVEQYFSIMETQGMLRYSKLYFIVLYLGAIVVSSFVSLFKHKNNHWYNAIGASGAVSAVLFTSIFFAPMDKILIYGILPVPGILMGVLYLGYSIYMSKKGNDNIGHDAHFIGAIYGFLFPLFIDFNLYKHFFNSLLQ